MKPSIAICVRAAATLLVASVMAQPAPTAQGHWEGTIEVPGQPLAIVVDLGTKGDAWRGTVSIPAQHVSALPLSDIAVKEDAVSFAMKGVPGDPVFKGKVDVQARTISGEFSQSGMTMPFALAWKGEPKFAPPPASTKVTTDVEGTWEGALSIGPTRLRLVVKIANTELAAHGILVSLDQGGAEIPITQIVQDGTKLTLSVDTIGARFEGEVKTDQIEGRWMQSSQSFPLLLKRPAK